jgi:peptidoglycan hydrolase-like protein with peptidoglycan-binding domain
MQDLLVGAGPSGANRNSPVRTWPVLLVVLCCSVVPLPGARAAEIGEPPIAALQVELISRSLYFGPVDGLAGPETKNALRQLQGQVGLRPTGVFSPLTRSALGPWAAPDLGSRMLHVGAVGWDVAELQFLLAWHGFPSGLFSGVYSERVGGAVERYQRSAGLTPDGIAGPLTAASLDSPLKTCPIRLRWPVRAPITSPFGPRGLGFHAGLDLGAPYGTAVRSAMAGRVTWAGYLEGGWGNLVVVSGSLGAQTLYAHLSEIDVSVGDLVSPQTVLGRVGETGDARGAHLHLEVRVNGAAVNPLPALS